MLIKLIPHQQALPVYPGGQKGEWKIPEADVSVPCHTCHQLFLPHLEHMVPAGVMPSSQYGQSDSGMVVMVTKCSAVKCRDLR